MKRVLAVLLAMVMIFSLVACGQEAKEKAEKYCSNCRGEVSIDDAFCKHCGMVLQNTKTESEDTSSDNVTSTESKPTETSKPTQSSTPAQTSKPTETSKPPQPQPIIYEGSGDQVITNINLDDGRYKVHVVYTGNSVFAVFGYDADDDMVLMKSSYGACNKEDILRQAKFPLLLDITANGSWKIEFEKID